VFPRQSVTVFVNVVDLSLALEAVKSMHGPKVVRHFDLPVTERAEAMRDLARRGITHASLFPGLDGVCRALGERFF
jgi:hypothetical protein